MSKSEDHHKDDPPCHVGQRLPAGSGSDTGWSVEARMNYHDPKVVAGIALDDRWRPLYFHKSPIGVPSPSGHSVLGLVGLYEYAAAQALRWWFIAEAGRDLSQMCLETRLVRHKVEYSYAAIAQEAVEPATWHRPTAAPTTLAPAEQVAR